MAGMLSFTSLGNTVYKHCFTFLIREEFTVHMIVLKDMNTKEVEAGDSLYYVSIDQERELIAKYGFSDICYQFLDFLVLRC